MNETLRKGLHAARSFAETLPVSDSLPRIGPDVNIDKARHIADALEDEEIIRKLEMGK